MIFSFLGLTSLRSSFTSTDGPSLPSSFTPSPPPAGLLPCSLSFTFSGVPAFSRLDPSGGVSAAQAQKQHLLSNKPKNMNHCTLYKKRFWNQKKKGEKRGVLRQVQEVPPRLSIFFRLVCSEYVPAINSPSDSVVSPSIHFCLANRNVHLSLSRRFDGPRVPTFPTSNNVKPQGSSHMLYILMWEHCEPNRRSGFYTWLH